MCFRSRLVLILWYGKPESLIGRLERVWAHNDPLAELRKSLWVRDTTEVFQRLPLLYNQRCFSEFSLKYKRAVKGRSAVKPKILKIMLIPDFYLPSRHVRNKNTHQADFETCVFREYLRNHLGYKKVIYINLHLCLKSFQMKKYFFNWQNRCFARKK